MHYLLIYDLSPDYLQSREPFRARHLALAWEAAERGELVLAGPVTEPADMGVLLFEGDSPAAAERFAQADPYVVNGVVTRWRVRHWNTVIGKQAASPVRPAT